MTDAAVSALKVEPGSNGAVNAREPRSPSAVAVGSLGSMVGHVGHGEQLARLRLHDDDGRPVGAHGLRLLLGDALHEPLQVGVDRELQRAAVVRPACA